MGYTNGHAVRLVGGRIALDFVNTADWSAEGKVVHEKLETQADLRAWAVGAGLGGLDLPRELKEALRLRSGMRRDLLALMASVAAGKFRPAIRPLRFQAPLLAAIEASSFGLFIDRREARRLKCCPGGDCGWLFVDETGNGRRRWCSMELCGNRTKVRRHYLRTNGQA